MKNIIKLFALISIVSVAYQGFGQKCQADDFRRHLISKNPNFLKLEKANPIITQNQLKKYKVPKIGTIITLPIVVHVVWKLAEDNISDDQIKGVIARLNSDFRKKGLNAFSKTPEYFENLDADIEVEFCLAQIDPSGKPTTGITRTNTTVDEIGTQGKESINSTQKGGIDPWDNTKYINIWVCKIGNNIAGYASPPYPNPDGTFHSGDGLILGTNEFKDDPANFSLARIITHEMGHYLGLSHLQGNDGGCDSDDGITDTPNQYTYSTGCAPTVKKFDACTKTGNGLLTTNYMDYIDYSCMTMFTLGQKAKMLSVINGPRAGLKNSNACSLVTDVSNSSFEESLLIYPNPSNKELTISLGESTNSTIHFTLMDLTGNVHLKFSVNESKRIDLSEVPEGMYLLTSEEYPNVTEKIIVTN